MRAAAGRARRGAAGRSRGGWPLLAAALFTGLNAAEPLVIDDAAYYEYARQIARSPSDPYGFEIFWYETPQPANSVLAPPVLPYWWAAAIALFGDRPALWKVWLFPFAWLLAAAVHALAARLAPGRETPLLWGTLFSAALLPNFNLMLDVPALALGLAALSSFARACEAGRAGPAVLAGLLLGLALQTKYSAVLALAAVLAYASLFRRARLGLLAAATGVALFAAWETFVALRYGDSHFWLALAAERARPEPSSALRAVCFLSLLGAVGGAAGLMAVVALGAGRRALAGAALALALPFALLPALEWARAQSCAPAWPHPEVALFALLGAGIGAALLAVSLRLARGGGATAADRFLVLWLALEVVGCFAISPFCAVRRLMGLVVAGALAAGRLSARRGADAGALRIAAAWSAALGLLFAASDGFDAWTGRRSVALAQERLAALGAPAGGGAIWYVGHWGFQFYAERAGWRPVVPGRSHLARGDWLVVPYDVARQKVRVGPQHARERARVAARSLWPFSTVPWAYEGPVPIRGAGGSRRVGIFEITADTTP